jgi:hypothetical protein
MRLNSPPSIFSKTLGTKKLEMMMSKFAIFHQDVTNVPISQPSWKNGDLCSAKFTEDEAW